MSLQSFVSKFRRIAPNYHWTITNGRLRAALPAVIKTVAPQYQNDMPEVICPMMAVNLHENGVLDHWMVSGFAVGLNHKEIACVMQAADGENEDQLLREQLLSCLVAEKLRVSA